MNPGQPADSYQVVPVFDRERLRIARELRGWTQVQLSREAGGLVTSASISQFEQGHARPSAATLDRLASALEFPVRFFARPARERAEMSPVGFFRSLRAAAPRERRRARAMADLVRELTLQIEQHVRLPELSLPRCPVDSDAGVDEVEQVADQIRSAWQLDAGPIPHVVRALERRGIVTTRFVVSMPEVDAFSVPFPDRPIVVLGADKGLKDRSRFDAAHELGHLVMHDDDCAGERSAERQANQFAAAFLMPADDIHDHLPRRLDWQRLVALKGVWQVSMAALLMRARTLEVMEEHTYVGAMKALSARGWRQREPSPLGPPESPLIIERALHLLADKGLALEALAAEAGLPLVDVQAVVGHSLDPRPEVRF